MPIPDFEPLARESLPDHVGAYFAAGAGLDECLTEGVADWSVVRFRPRVLRDLSVVDAATTVLGTPVRTPILVPPMAQQLAAHPEAERATARAVGAEGGLLGISTNTAVPFADIERTGTPWWYQVYVSRARELTEILVRRAVDHGARALMLTVDATFFSATHPSVDPLNWPESPGKARMTNLTADEIAAAGPEGIRTSPNVTFADIGWLHELSGLPVLVKGVLRDDDAKRAVDSGAAGIVVSTHGARRMGASTTSARALPEIVAAVGDQVEVLADSGLRSGQHVAAALAMGARAVFIGRPILWGLAAHGEDGVRQVLQSLNADLISSMGQLGVTRVSEFGPDLLAR